MTDPPDRTASRSAPVLVFDGECRFCTWAVEWLKPRFAIAVDTVPWQRADLRLLGLSRRQVERFVWWIDPSGGRWKGHRAVARILSACAPPWPRVGRIVGCRALAPLAGCLYRAISAVRRVLPGVRPAVHS